MSGSFKWKIKGLIKNKDILFKADTFFNGYLFRRIRSFRTNTTEKNIYNNISKKKFDYPQKCLKYGHFREYRA